MPFHGETANSVRQPQADREIGKGHVFCQRGQGQGRLALQRLRSVTEPGAAVEVRSVNAACDQGWVRSAAVNLVAENSNKTPSFRSEILRRGTANAAPAQVRTRALTIAGQQHRNLVEFTEMGPAACWTITRTGATEVRERYETVGMHLLARGARDQLPDTAGCLTAEASVIAEVAVTDRSEIGG